MTKSYNISKLLSDNNIKINHQTEGRLNSFQSIDGIKECDGTLIIFKKMDDTVYNILRIKPDGASEFGIYISVTN